MIFRCFSTVSFARFSRSCALEISFSTSIRPLTSRNTVAADPTVYTAQPVGAASEGDRIVMEDTVLPVRERSEGSEVGEERMVCVVASSGWM